MKLALRIVVSRTLSDVVRFVCLSFCIFLSVSLSFPVLQYWHNFFFFFFYGQNLELEVTEILALGNLISMTYACHQKYTIKGPFLLFIYHRSALNRENFICIQTLRIGNPGIIFYSFPASPTVIEWKRCWMSQFAISSTVPSFGCLSLIYTLLPMFPHNNGNCSILHLI